MELPKEYANHLYWAEKNKKQIGYLIEALRKQKRKDLDELFARHHDEAFEEIDCLECAYCCATTPVRILHREVEKLAKAVRMRPPTFRKHYLAEDEDQDQVFNAVPCPFLGGDKHCLIYENRPKACEQYPHTNEDKMKNKLGMTQTNAFICPAVALMMKNMIEELGIK